MPFKLLDRVGLIPNNVGHSIGTAFLNPQLFPLSIFLVTASGQHADATLGERGKHAPEKPDCVIDLTNSVLAGFKDKEGIHVKLGLLTIFDNGFLNLIFDVIICQVVTTSTITNAWGINYNELLLK